MKFLTTITIEEDIKDAYDIEKLSDLYMMFQDDEEEVYNVLADGVIKQLKEALVFEPKDKITCVVKRIDDDQKGKGLTKDKKEILKNVVGSASLEGLNVSETDEDELKLN